MVGVKCFLWWSSHTTTIITQALEWSRMRHCMEEGVGGVKAPINCQKP